MNQPVVPDNLVREACQRPHYRVNFVCSSGTIAGQQNLSALRNSVVSVFRRVITRNANSIQTVTFCPVWDVRYRECQLREVPL